MIFDYKFILMVAGTLLGLGNYGLYLKNILDGKFRPHLFSWAIWTLLCTIAFAAQLSEHAGYATMQTGLMALGTAVIAIAAYFKGDRNYTRTDWMALLFSLSAIPLWILTSNALWAVILITVIDVVATWPTARKSWHKPSQESPRTFFIAGFGCLLGVGSLSVFNATTTLYIATIAAVNLAVGVMILYRRQVAVILP